MTVEVFHGDCLAVIPELLERGILVDATVCDPPYHLTPTVNRFGKAGSAPAKHGRDGVMARLSSGFMSVKWDGGDTAFRPETWATVASIMRPGAFLVAFGGTRTVHRLASAIEDAGFIIQDSILDLIATDARVRVFLETLSASQADAFSQILDDLQPTGALAWAFGTGFPKRRDMLKPAYEPIVLAYKPGGKRTMQVDECRIGTEGGITRHTVNGIPGRWDSNKSTGEETINGGRWPANILTDGSDEVVAAFPESAGQQGDLRGHKAERESPNGILGKFPPAVDHSARLDSGSAARFFFSSKAGAQDRWGSKHPTVKPVELMKWLVALVCPPGGTVLDPFAGSGTTAVAALGTGRNAILIEREDQYVADIRERVAFYEGGGAHSVQAKNRNRTPLVRDGDLFAPPSEPRRQIGDLWSVGHPLLQDNPAPQPGCVSDRTASNTDTTTKYNASIDSVLSFDVAIKTIGEQVKAGEPLPTGGYFGVEK